MQVAKGRNVLVLGALACLVSGCALGPFMSSKGSATSASPTVESTVSRSGSDPTATAAGAGALSGPFGAGGYYGYLDIAVTKAERSNIAPYEYGKADAKADYQGKEYLYVSLRVRNASKENSVSLDFDQFKLLSGDQVATADEAGRVDYTQLKPSDTRDVVAGFTVGANFDPATAKLVLGTKGVPLVFPLIGSERVETVGYPSTQKLSVTPGSLPGPKGGCESKLSISLSTATAMVNLSDAYKLYASDLAGRAPVGHRWLEVLVPLTLATSKACSVAIGTIPLDRSSAGLTVDGRKITPTVVGPSSISLNQRGTATMLFAVPQTAKTAQFTFSPTTGGSYQAAITLPAMPLVPNEDVIK